MFLGMDRLCTKYASSALTQRPFGASSPPGLSDERHTFRYWLGTQFSIDAGDADVLADPALFHQTTDLLHV
jgi:hypothetical protein